MLLRADAKADEFPRRMDGRLGGASFLNASQVTTLVNHCRTYNFNAVIVQMRRRGDVFSIPHLPDNATIVSVTLKLRRGTLSGVDPLTTHGTCYDDIKSRTGSAAPRLLPPAIYRPQPMQPRWRR